MSSERLRHIIFQSWSVIVFKTNNLQHEDCSSLSFKMIFKPRPWQNFGDQVLQIWKSFNFQLVPMWWRCVMCRSFGLKGQLKKVKQWWEPTLERTVCTKSNNCKRNRSSRYKFVEMGHFCIYPRSKKFVSLLCVWWDLLDPRPYRGIPGTV